MGGATMGPLPNIGYVNGTWDARIHIHELGHLLGMHHSHSLTCGGGQALCSGGTRVEYGNPYDIMGSGSTGDHPNALQKTQMGWLTPAVAPAEGTVPLTPIEATPSAIRVNRPGLADWLSVELRAPGRVLVNWQRTTYPGPNLLRVGGNGFPMRVGIPWTDPDTKQQLTVTALSRDAATLRVGAAPPPQPPQGGSATFTPPGDPSPWAVAVAPFTCQRIASGGTNSARILEGTKIRKKAGQAAPAQGIAFTLTCEVSATHVRLHLDGVVKVTYTRP